MYKSTKKSIIPVKYILSIPELNRQIVTEENKSIQLPLNLLKNGFNYTQVQRGLRSCIYRQELLPNLAYYEVFLIKIKSEEVILGKWIPEREVFPGNEAFGYWAWSYRTLESAKDKFNKLERNMSWLIL